MPITIFCGDCGAHGAVNRVTAALQCACGSTNLGLDGVDAKPSHVVAERRKANRWNNTDPEGGTAEDQSPRGGGTPAKRGDDPLSEEQGAKIDEHVKRNLAPRGPHRESAAKGPENYSEGTSPCCNAQGHRPDKSGDFFCMDCGKGFKDKSQAEQRKQGAGGTGWGKPMPSPTRGWSDYAGPTPANYPRSAPVNDSQRCPACNGTGYDMIDKTVCRECNGVGTINAPTSRPSDYLHPEQQDAHQGPPAGGARWQGKGASIMPPQFGTTSAPTFSGYLTPTYTTGSSATITYPATYTAGRPSVADPYGPEYQNVHTAPGYGKTRVPPQQFDADKPGSYYPSFPNRSPATRTREDRSYPHGEQPYQMDEAVCPNCHHSPLELRKDKSESAWAFCPNCGPLANVDKNPSIDPYHFPEGFTPDRGMKTSSLFRTRKTGKLMQMLAVIHENNDVHPAEAVSLARKTLAAYGEEQ